MAKQSVSDINTIEGLEDFTKNYSPAAEYEVDIDKLREHSAKVLEALKALNQPKKLPFFRFQQFLEEASGPDGVAYLDSMIALSKKGHAASGIAKDEFFNMGPEQRERVGKTVNELGSTIKLTQTQFNLIKEAKAFKTDDDYTELATCIKALNKAKLPLTRFIGKGPLATLVEQGPKGIGGLLNKLSTNDNLNRSTFNYIMKNVKYWYADKAGSLINIFDTMNNNDSLKKHIKSNRKALMKMSSQDLKTFDTVLKGLGKNELGRRAFNKIRSAIPKMGYNDIQASELANCIKQLQGKNIPLTSAFRSNLDRLLKVDKAHIGTVSKILTELAKEGKQPALDADIFKYIAANAAKLHEKMPVIHDVLTKMNELDITIKGHRRPLMGLEQNQLENMKSFLTALSGPPIQPVKIDKSSFKILRDNAEHLKGTNAQNTATCLKALTYNNMEINPTTGRNRLKQLMAIAKNHGEGTLANVTKVIKDLSNNRDEGKARELDEKTFKYIVNHPEQFEDPGKTDALIEIFKTIRQNNLKVVGNRQPLMKMSKEALVGLNAFIKGPPQQDNVKQNTFKILRNNASKLDDPSFRQELNECLNLMATCKGNKPNSRQWCARLEALMKLDKEQLGRAKQLIQTLSESNALDRATFHYIAKNAGKFDAEKTQLICETFKTMNTKGVAIKGARQPLMNASPEVIRLIKNDVDNDKLSSASASRVKAQINAYKAMGNDFNAFEEKLEKATQKVDELSSMTKEKITAAETKYNETKTLKNEELSEAKQATDNAIPEASTRKLQAEEALQLANKAKDAAKQLYDKATGIKDKGQKFKILGSKDKADATSRVVELAKEKLEKAKELEAKAKAQLEAAEADLKKLQQQSQKLASLMDALKRANASADKAKKDTEANAQDLGTKKTTSDASFNIVASKASPAEAIKQIHEAQTHATAYLEATKSNLGITNTALKDAETLKDLAKGTPLEDAANDQFRQASEKHDAFKQQWTQANQRVVGLSELLAKKEQELVNATQTPAASSPTQTATATEPNVPALSSTGDGSPVLHTPSSATPNLTTLPGDPPTDPKHNTLVS